MGNSCSSGQAHKDKDNVSQHSEESASYGARAQPASASAPPSQPPEPPEPAATKPLLKNPRPLPSVSDSISLSSPVTSGAPREASEGPPVPGSVAALPEEHRGSLVGRAPPTRTRRRRAMIIYVCAADSQDCCAEKGALQCGAAAKLRVRARRRGWRVHVADLHWRSPLEQQRDHRFPVLCIAELARQSELGAVVPVVFLNAGLGTPLLPHTLECADFKAALDAADDDADRALLNKWYTLESSSTPPCYRLVRGAPARWRREMARALNVLVRTLPQEACDAYLTTVVEQEIQHTVLMSAEAARRCVWVCRAGALGGGGGVGGAGAGGRDSPDGEGAGDAPHRAELQRRLNNLQRDLKSHLSERNIIRASVRRGPGVACPEDEYTEQVRAALGDRLDALLDALIAEHTVPHAHHGIPISLFDELNEHLLFCEKAAQCTSNREITLNELKSYITGDSSVPLALIGGAGCGKATLVARAVTRPQPDATIIVRFVGLTPQSSSSHQLLKSIVDQCHVLHTGTLYRGRNDVASLSAALPRLLAAVARSRPVLLAVVGADALRGARWLPSKLPERVKMIVTVTEETDEPSSSAIMAVLSSEDGPRVVRAPGVCAGEARAVLAACAAAYSHTGHTAASPPERAHRALQRCTLPLYAKILAWQISLSTETFTEQSESESSPELLLSPDLETQLAQILATTEQALGVERVRTCLALVTAARRGLDDSELLDILAHDPLFRSDETYLPWAPASLFWPQVAALLQPWLRWDARGAARWRDAALASAARDRYLADHETTVRQTLVDYYEGVWYEENDPKMAGRLISQENRFSDTCYNTRKLDELPFQYYHLYKGDPTAFASRPYFTDLDTIYDKLCATDTGSYLEDIGLVHLEPLPEHVEILKEVFEAHSHALDYDTRQFYGLLRAVMERRKRDGRDIRTKVVQNWMRDVWDPPVPTLYPANQDFWKVMEAKEKREGLGAETSEGKAFDCLVRLDSRGKYVASVSTEREEIAVWDVTQCKMVRKLVGVSQPINLVPIDEYRCVVLCKRELKVYDLDQGKFVVSLKGVMNQKMPYYGLHDARHLVALARNRMYVNLMNIETGDCVTTFKAGEDRFLNSLLVSGDGRVLVCGDETQKPFPLLVWSLTSRKLLYDLRIPHHDFLTSKAAITYEGSYVCVVSRELDEPSPNFIVVYDLQSGTLFKKWKPGCDTEALAISSVDGCVVSGLADTRILVWDLVTGNCRLTLRGHTAAPSLLRLARSGGVLLSTDASCRDLSVRLWDLHTGKLISVYTPPERITSCEMLLGGSVIALALENYKEILCLKLHGPQVESVKNAREIEYDDRGYGDVSLDGNTFDVKGDC